MAEEEHLYSGLMRGIPVSEGIAIGKVHLIQSLWDEVASITITKKNLQKEINRYTKALQTAAEQLHECQDHVEHEIGKDESKIFEAHLTILQDPFFQEEVPENIQRTLSNSEVVLKEGIEKFVSTFQKMRDPYIKQRIDDIQDVGMRVLRILLQTEDLTLAFGESTILVAHNLTPSETARLDVQKTLGFATELGGETSHVSILARSMGLPAVVGVERLMRKAKQDETIIIDGNAGIVYLDPPQRVIKGYEKQKGQLVSYWKKLSDDIELSSETEDGTAIDLHANVSMTADVSMAARYRATGIGLFRTELPFLIAGRLLSEEEQFQIYKTVIESMKGKDVTIRTLDLGGDKFLPFEDMEQENNPFLGWRSIRISLQEKQEFKKQLRAILRASHFGCTRILYPMISSCEEIFAIRKVVEECQAELDSLKVPYNKDIQHGIMIEVPSAAIMADKLIELVDFMSIGTNDLIQYALAVDRNNEKVARFYQPLNPGVLSLIQQVIKVANDAKKPISICGEMAGNPIYAPLFLGFGLRTFSMSPIMLPELKERIRVLTIEECKTLVDEVFQLSCADDIQKVLWKFHRRVNKRQHVPYFVKKRNGFEAEIPALSKKK